MVAVIGAHNSETATVSPEVLPCDRESSVATSRSAVHESVGRDEALPSGGPAV